MVCSLTIKTYIGWKARQTFYGWCYCFDNYLKKNLRELIMWELVTLHWTLTQLWETIQSGYRELRYVSNLLCNAIGEDELRFSDLKVHYIPPVTLLSFQKNLYIPKSFTVKIISFRFFRNQCSLFYDFQLCKLSIETNLKKC